MPEVKVTEEMVQALRNQVEQPLVDFLSTPLIPEGMLGEEHEEEDQETRGERSMPQEQIPTPQEMVRYLYAYQALLPAEASGCITYFVMELEKL